MGKQPALRVCDENDSFEESAVSLEAKPTAVAVNLAEQVQPVEWRSDIHTVRRAYFWPLVKKGCHFSLAGGGVSQLRMNKPASEANRAG